jgi:hypothetical protein
MRAWFLLFCLALPVLGQPGLPGVGGMLYLGNQTFLVAHDAKAAQPPRPRLGLLRVASHGVRYQALEVDWTATGESSDVESLCAVPGRPDRFLAIESRQFQGKYGRILVMERQGEQIRSLAAIYLPVLEAQVEGSACLPLEGGRLLLVMGGRGGDPPYAPGRLHWGLLDLESNRFELSASGREGMDLPPPLVSSDPYTRGISDLYLDPAGYLWVACADEMSDLGPLRSVVYRAGRLHPRLESPPLEPFEPQELVWVVDGYKVEALAAPCVENSVLSFGTDDELLGGTWRPLPPAAPYRVRP